jgi:hypothetical protein
VSGAAHMRKYLERFGVTGRRTLQASGTADVDRAVVIPALAERRHLFRTLADLARNPAAELARTLVVCVVNNGQRGDTAADIIADNDETLRILTRLSLALPAQADSGHDADGDANLPLRAARCHDAQTDGMSLVDGDGSCRDRHAASDIGGDRRNMRPGEHAYSRRQTGFARDGSLVMRTGEMASDRADLRAIAESGLRIAWIDAASAGVELPDRWRGVGLARKIGLDAALEIFAAEGRADGVLVCLDADTRVEENYLAAVRSFFVAPGAPHAAVIAYSHELPADEPLRTAICCYEIFLRSYTLGLSYARSPYAFHTIGSTMACTAGGYAAVRAMNRLAAGEDFYFLNKLAKLGGMGCIGATVVHPSARFSCRVPFGTGQRMHRFVSGSRDEQEIYAPETFVILRRWLELATSDPDRSGEEILACASALDARLAAFLAGRDFPGAWNRIRRNCRRPAFLRRQFHDWFDGFVTLKLIHYLTDNGLPRTPMFSAAARLLEMAGGGGQWPRDSGIMPDFTRQQALLSLLRLDASRPFSYTAGTLTSAGPGKPELIPRAATCGGLSDAGPRRDMGG